ncbi:Hypothetical_protein [Hexamita inflata]|uniref:Hypothetical_protein n=1 Tax=Hexamita inflata TaxID=28002 RepID=A0AA86U7G2_9EUKA|nr:Hypothetical protein HINF_LOCUS31724 [Hexamita inflata]
MQYIQNYNKTSLSLQKMILNNVRQQIKKENNNKETLKPTVDIKNLQTYKSIAKHASGITIQKQYPTKPISPQKVGPGCYNPVFKQVEPTIVTRSISSVGHQDCFTYDKSLVIGPDKYDTSTIYNPSKAKGSKIRVRTEVPAKSVQNDVFLDRARFDNFLTNRKIFSISNSLKDKYDVDKVFD